MVNIDTVYQRVLALANKEQRGYITPQEFNLFANQAQMEIFEQYFYDLHNFELRDAIGTLNEETTDLTRQKRDMFLRTAGPNQVNNYQVVGQAVVLPDFIYRIARLEVNNNKAEYYSNDKFKDIITGPPLIRPTTNRPVWTFHRNRVRVNDGNNIQLGIGLHYWIIPPTVSWGYFVLNDKALFDASANKTTHFELHASEETELIYKILRLAGISMKKQDVVEAGQGIDILQQKNEKQ
tara:strand:+ start:96 stop:806 length:711 start_codon:yes stop_codon:yes gene_type:complete